MEPDGQKRFQIGPKVVVHLDAEFIRRMAIPRPKDPDDQEYMEHVAFWEAILGVHPYYRSRITGDEVSECYTSLVETVTSEQEVGEHKLEAVGDDASFETQGRHLCITYSLFWIN
ncbi:uncharacterized protein LOC120653890 [Panicum virgatum]|uniref:uncharacterized protein LOC120653890 n=1 Tax=Panicum virgatum TaxID=38727 RepID=UPI0019D639CE|nr:uncharacterized protein LOC120653890 [Panicum virgatum]